MTASDWVFPVVAGGLLLIGFLFIALTEFRTGESHQQDNTSIKENITLTPELIVEVERYQDNVTQPMLPPEPELSIITNETAVMNETEVLPNGGNNITEPTPTENKTDNSTHSWNGEEWLPR